MKRRLRVVEMLCGWGWSATVGVALTRDDGKEQLKEWKENNPCDKVRLVKYEPVE